MILYYLKPLSSPSNTTLISANCILSSCIIDPDLLSIHHIKQGNLPTNQIWLWSLNAYHMVPTVLKIESRPFCVAYKVLCDLPSIYFSSSLLTSSPKLCSQLLLVPGVHPALSFSTYEPLPTPGCTPTPPNSGAEISPHLWDLRPHVTLALWMDPGLSHKHSQVLYAIFYSLLPPVHMLFFSFYLWLFYLHCKFFLKTRIDTAW